MRQPSALRHAGVRNARLSYSLEPRVIVAGLPWLGRGHRGHRGWADCGTRGLANAETGLANALPVIGDASLLVSSRNLLGESPVFDDRTGVLYWLDCLSHRLDCPVRGASDVW